MIPENLTSLGHEEGYLDEKAKAVVLLMRLDPDQVNVSEDRKDWNVDGIFAYSKVCTTWAAPSPCTSSTRTTCCARATSPRSTSRTSVRSSSARRPAPCAAAHFR